MGELCLGILLFRSVDKVLFKYLQANNTLHVCIFTDAHVLHNLTCYELCLQLNHKRLRLWFIITGTLMTVGLIFFFAEVLRHEDFWDVIIITAVNTIFTLYSMWVVYVLIREIKSGGARHPVPYHNGFYKL